MPNISENIKKGHYDTYNREIKGKGILNEEPLKEGAATNKSTIYKGKYSKDFENNQKKDLILKRLDVNQSTTKNIMITFFNNDDNSSQIEIQNKHYGDPEVGSKMVDLLKLYMDTSFRKEQNSFFLSTLESGIAFTSSKKYNNIKDKEQRVGTDYYIGWWENLLDKLKYSTNNSTIGQSLIELPNITIPILEKKKRKKQIDPKKKDNREALKKKQKDVF